MGTTRRDFLSNVIYGVSCSCVVFGLGITCGTTKKKNEVSINPESIYQPAGFNVTLVSSKKLNNAWLSTDRKLIPVLFIMKSNPNHKLLVPTDIVDVNNLYSQIENFAKCKEVADPKYGFKYMYIIYTSTIIDGKIGYGIMVSDTEYEIYDQD